MSERRRDSDALPLSAAERAALDTWEAPPPPRDLAEQVLARLDHEERRPRARLSPWLWAAAAALAVIAVAASWLLRGGDVAGHRTVAARATLAIGERAVAVAEAGSELSWRVAAGAAGVSQPRGDVFYRVEPGAPFVVSTPAGTVKVLGTCFRVEVRTMKSKRAAAAGALVGAAVATAVLVSVYEGKVLSAPKGGEAVEVAAGEAAQMERGAARLVVAGPRGTGRAPSAAGGSARPGDTPAAALARRNQQLERRARACAAENETLRQQLAGTEGKASRSKQLDLSQEELRRMAKRCELRWDLPSLGTDPPSIGAKTRERLGLNENEVALMNQVLGEYHKQMLARLRKLYVEVTGDEKVVNSLSPRAMISEISDKSPRQETKVVYQRLARERAGLQRPPASTAAASPMERLMRLLTSAGDRLERAIAAKIGPDLARRHRELRDGYGSRSRSRVGCP